MNVRILGCRNFATKQMGLLVGQRYIGSEDEANTLKVRGKTRRARDDSFPEPLHGTFKFSVFKPTTLLCLFV